MKRTLLISVAAVALAAGSTVALSQGSGGGAGGAPSAPMANPSAPSGGQDTQGGKGHQKGAQERAMPEKQKSTQAPGGHGATTKQSMDDKSGQAPTSRQSQDGKSGHAPTTRQSRDEKSGHAPTTQQSQDKSGQPPTQQHTQGQQPTTQQKTTQSPPAGGSKQGSAQRSMTSSNVSLTTEQKTKIRSTVLTGSAPRVTNVNFDIKVGTVVPRAVRVAPLPPTLIEIQPSWRGYMYFVYQDEIIVVEPGTLRIVAVLEV
jgi:hypothetical protein